eukprot:jgi/Mesen1/3163/ME000184S02227
MIQDGAQELLNREKRVCRRLTATKIPQSHEEREFGNLGLLDKVFAAKWLDEDSFVVGTKDNKLIRWDAKTDRRVNIPLPKLTKHRERGQDTCGIHSISVNASGTLLATGGSHPNDVAVFKLPSFEPVALLAKHEDWLFSAAWITDNLLVTGSRDHTVKLWSIGGQKFFDEDPVIDTTQHSDKVRDLKYDSKGQKVATLSHDATCKIWDTSLMKPVETVVLEHRRELVCLALEHPLVAVGSQSFITFIDMRCGHVVKNIKSVDEDWGVRSLSFKDNIVTCGGGKGRLSFLDMRIGRYISLQPRHEEKGKETVCSWESESTYYFTTGKGHLHQNDVYEEYFMGQEVRHAVYAHEYDASGTRLLVAGGPLPFGLKGCYVSVW